MQQTSNAGKTISILYKAKFTKSAHFLQINIFEFNEFVLSLTHYLTAIMAIFGHFWSLYTGREMIKS